VKYCGHFYDGRYYVEEWYDWWYDEYVWDYYDAYGYYRFSEYEFD
jgi:hypothetical protein